MHSILRSFLLILIGWGCFAVSDVTASTLSLGGNTWYFASSGTDATAGSLTDSSGTLAYKTSSSTANSMIWTYFSAQTLVSTGDSLTLNFTLSDSSITNTSASLRIGLFNSGGTQVTNNLSGTIADPGFNNYTGDSSWVATHSSGTTASTIEDRSSASQTLWASAAFTSLGTGSGGALTANTPSNDSLTLTKVATGIQVTVSLGATTFSYIDTSGRTSSFDTLSFFSTAATDTLTLSNLSITYAAVPEPGTTALLGIGTMLAALPLWRRRHAS